MKSHLFSALLFVALMFALPTSFNAQDSDGPPVAVVLDFMKGHPGSGALEMEAEAFKPIHQVLVDGGEKLAWYCYEVLFPNGKDVEYNYVTVNVYKSGKDFMESMEDGDSWSAAFAKAHPDKKQEDVWKAISDARDWMRSEMFVFIDEAVEGSGPPAEYISVNYMKVAEGRGSDYIAMEREIFKPVHQAQVERGTRQDWGLYARRAPWGAAFDYNFITVDVHGSLDNMFAGQGGLWSEVHPDLSASNAFEKMAKLRSLQRSETWKLVSYARAQ